MTIAHKGNNMKFTEGGFRDWTHILAQREFGAVMIDGGPWCKFKNSRADRDIIIKDSIADAFPQQILLRHMGWTAAADLIIASMERSIASKKVTCGFARLMEGATQASCSGFEPGDDRPSVSASGG